MNRWHLTEAVADTLTAALGKPYRPTKAPELATGQTLAELVATGYGIVYAIPGKGYTRTFDGGYPVVDVSYQVTNVGKNEAHAEWLANASGSFLLMHAHQITSAALVSDGCSVINCSPNASDGPSEGSDGLVTIGERFTFTVSYS